MPDKQQPISDPLWQERIDRLERYRRLATEGGKAYKEKASKRKGLGPRERLMLLCDPDTLVEFGAYTGLTEKDGPLPADGYVAGVAKIHGRPVAVGAEDFSVLAGSISKIGMSKRERLARLAGQEKIPLVAILEGAGARASSALDKHTPAPIDLQTLADLSGYVPTVSVVTGPSAGHGALTSTLSDLVIMVAGQASLFSAGPPLVQAATGEKVDKLTLGGAAVHSQYSGLTHLVTESEQGAFKLAQRYLSYLPSNAWQRPPWLGPEQGNGDIGKRSLDGIFDLLPPDDRYPYDIKLLMEMVVDEGSLLELQADYGRAIVTSLARIGGHAVAIVANQPRVGGGAIDVIAANKAADFMEKIGAFHLPMVFLADTPGMQAGTASEKAGILKSGGRMYFAQHRLQVPKVHVALRKSYGFGSPLMGMNNFDGRTVCYALPGVTLGAMPAKSTAEFAAMDAENSCRLLEEMADGPWKPAGDLSYDDIIDPRQLRNTLLDWVELRCRDNEPVAPLRSPSFT